MELDRVLKMNFCLADKYQPELSLCIILLELATRLKAYDDCRSYKLLMIPTGTSSETMATYDTVRHKILWRLTPSIHKRKAASEKKASVTAHKNKTCRQPVVLHGICTASFCFIFMDYSQGILINEKYLTFNISFLSRYN
jgi:hypothetical protein